MRTGSLSRHALGARSRGLMVLLTSGLVLLLSAGPTSALTQSLVASPSQVLLGKIDASLQSESELTDGLTLFLPVEDPAPSLIVSVSRPLTHSVTRATLPVDRLRVGVAELDATDLSSLGPLLALGDAGRTLRLVAANGRARLRVGVALDKFDPPGIYQGELSLTLANSTVPPLRVEVQCEACKWVQVSSTGLVVQLNASAPPGPSSHLSSGWTGTLKVASNCPWRLTALPNGDFVNQSAGANGTIPSSALTLKVQSTEFVKPISLQYVALSNQPTLLATGSPTVAASGGSATVTLDGQLAFGRQYGAGSYQDSLKFSVAPQ